MSSTFFVVQAEDGIRDALYGLEFRRMRLRSRIGLARLKAVIMRETVRCEVLMAACQDRPRHRWGEIIRVLPFTLSHFIQIFVVRQSPIRIGDRKSVV